MLFSLVFYFRYIVLNEMLIVRAIDDGVSGQRYDMSMSFCVGDADKYVYI
jgi:hypothetical protein